MGVQRQLAESPCPAVMQKSGSLSSVGSLLFAGVSVLDLGQVYRGPWSQRYWSSSGCLFHHAYPVGYKACKQQFGRSYVMSIEQGPQGPVFKVGMSCSYSSHQVLRLHWERPQTPQTAPTSVTHIPDHFLQVQVMLMYIQVIIH